MNLKGMHVYSRYGKEGYSVTVELSGQHGELKLNLPPEFGERVIEAAMDEIASHVRVAANLVTADLRKTAVDAQKELEHG